MKKTMMIIFLLAAKASFAQNTACSPADKNGNQICGEVNVEVDQTHYLYDVSDLSVINSEKSTSRPLSLFISPNRVCHELFGAEFNYLKQSRNVRGVALTSLACIANINTLQKQAEPVQQQYTGQAEQNTGVQQQLPISK